MKRAFLLFGMLVLAGLLVGPSACFRAFDPNGPQEDPGPSDPTDPTDPTDPADPPDGGRPNGRRPCEDDGECREGFTCIEGVCTGGAGPPCGQTSDCLGGQVCLFGTCQFPPLIDCLGAEGCEEPVLCSESAECGAGSTCSGGVCVPEKSQYCLEDGDCASGFCAAGICDDDGFPGKGEPEPPG